MWFLNKRPMGHITNLRKWFKSINTCDSIIMLIRRKINITYFLRIQWFFSSSFEQIWIPFTQGCFVPNLVEIDPVVLEQKSKIGKVYIQMYGQMTDRWQVRKAHSSFQLRWAKKVWMKPLKEILVFSPFPLLTESKFAHNFIITLNILIKININKNCR